MTSSEEEKHLHVFFVRLQAGIAFGNKWSSATRKIVIQRPTVALFNNYFGTRENIFATDHRSTIWIWASDVTI
jgi:hypothetical protein